MHLVDTNRGEWSVSYLCHFSRLGSGEGTSAFRGQHRASSDCGCDFRQMGWLGHYGPSHLPANTRLPQPQILTRSDCAQACLFKHPIAFLTTMLITVEQVGVGD